MHGCFRFATPLTASASAIYDLESSNIPNRRVANMVIDKLRDGTRRMHERLEQEMIPFIHGATNTGAYIKLLHLFYGYYAPLEEGILQHIDSSVLPDLSERRSVTWILKDLAELGSADDQILIDSNAPLINSRADALGALYVIEGSSLGGKVICRMLADSLGYSDVSALSFFNGYAGSTGSKWKEFLAVLDRYSDTADEEKIVQKANEVFEKFGQWLRINLS